MKLLLAVTVPVFSALLTRYEYKNDIAVYLDKPTEDDILKLKVLKKPWMPPASFKFPSIGKRNLSFQRQWFQKYSWLVYTNISGGGALCKVCVLFGKKKAVLVIKHSEIL